MVKMYVLCLKKVVYTGRPDLSAIISA